jgi:hypothetical protein
MSANAVRAICQVATRLFAFGDSVTRGRFRTGSVPGELIVRHSGEPPLRRPFRAGAVVVNTDVVYLEPCEGAGAGAVGAGASGFGDVEPEPLVLGVLLMGALLVAVGDEPLLAVVLLLL